MQERSDSGRKDHTDGQVCSHRGSHALALIFTLIACDDSGQARL
jgi:hypothetical protein